MKKLGLRDKTHKKFLEFFEKMADIHGNNEFEIAFSEIQRGTGAASTTLKRALDTLKEDGVIEVSPGRNSRYAKFKYLLAPAKPVLNQAQPPADVPAAQAGASVTMAEPTPKGEELKDSESIETLSLDVKELTFLLENLRRRMRTQEIAIALLQDRLAELEDKLHKR